MNPATVHTPLVAAARRGFTLIELICALAITAILIGAIYTVFHGTLRLRETTFGAVEAGLPTDYAERLMRRDLAGALPPGGTLAGQFAGTSDAQNAGRMDHLDFFTASGVLTAGEPWGDIQEVQYYLLEPGEQSLSMSSTARRMFTGAKSKSMDLVRATKRNLVTTVTQDANEEHLLQNVASLEITYYDGQDWLDDWDSTVQNSTNPTAVKIRITFAVPESEAGTTTSKASGPRLHPPIEMVCELVVKAQPANATPTPAGGR